jgi:amidase
VAAGLTTAEECVTEALARLAMTDVWLRAFIEVTADGAFAAARGIDALVAGGHHLPRLAGVPIAVKGRAGKRSVQAERLRAAGAIPIGGTSTPRGSGAQTWGSTDRGPTRNPWRGDLSPGGSSAGSAAAVAAGVVPLATGSDGAGSVRIPAAWCGIFGYKPTTALLPGAGRDGLTVGGALARAPGDLAEWAAAVIGPLPPASAVRTVTWSADLGYASAEVDGEIAEIARAAAGRLVASAGLRWRDAPVRLADPARAWTTFRDPHSRVADRAAATELRADNDRRLSALFEVIDLLLTPTTPGRPHGHEGPGERLSVALTWAFNLSGHPVVSVPAGFTADGAPVGLQVVARQWADRQLLELVRHLPVAPVARVVDGPGRRYVHELRNPRLSPGYRRRSWRLDLTDGEAGPEDRRAAGRGAPCSVNSGIEQDVISAPRHIVCLTRCLDPGWTAPLRRQPIVPQTRALVTPAPVVLPLRRSTGET